jgi:hypothetical protein
MAILKHKEDKRMSDSNHGGHVQSQTLDRAKGMVAGHYQGSRMEKDRLSEGLLATLAAQRYLIISQAIVGKRARDESRHVILGGKREDGKEWSHPFSSR